jgi:hypothetical protein
MGEEIAVGGQFVDCGMKPQPRETMTWPIAAHPTQRACRPEVDVDAGEATRHGLEAEVEVVSYLGLGKPVGNMNLPGDPLLRGLRSSWAGARMAGNTRLTSASGCHEPLMAGSRRPRRPATSSLAAARSNAAACASARSGSVVALPGRVGITASSRSRKPPCWLRLSRP